MREVYKNIFLCEIPLKGNPLKSINIYVVKTDELNMIVDTGFNTPEIIEETEKYIAQLDLDLSKTILFLTHLHSDHTGLASYFDKKGVKIYMGEVDGKMVEDMRNRGGYHWTSIIENARKQGLDEDGVEIDDHPGFKFRPIEEFSYTPVNPGDKINVGEFNFEVVDLEGHTPGMVGLYERDKNILFSGDHILGKITPNIQFWGFEYGDSLGIYLENIDKVRDMNIEYLFSSHRFLIEDVAQRVEELHKHHERRLNEARNTLKEKGPSTVRTVTKSLQWDISAKNWDEFPKSQKWFAAGEGQAHLERLRFLGEVDFFTDENGILFYYLK